MTATDRRELDFIVIGVQKGGTTSLWEYLRHHPRVAMLAYKEAQVFCAPEAQIPGLLGGLMQSSFSSAAADAKLGKVATYYMMGWEGVDVESVAGRIARTLPEVRLIALLRDPIERAMSHYRMSVRRGFERRSFDEAVEQLLRADGLEAGRKSPTEVNSYLTQGEYGRIVGLYRQRFPAERIHVEMTSDLDREPGSVVDRVLAFLGLPAGYRPADLEARHHLGGTKKVLDAQSEAQLREFCEEHIWPAMPERGGDARKAFDFFMETWNVVPDRDLPELSGENRRRLTDHYLADASLLADLGIESPWLGAWRA